MVNEPEPVIYVVDDDESFRTAVQRLLSAAGYGVQTFSSVPEFLAFRSPGQPGCVLADLQMPGASGLDLLEELNRRHDLIPLVFLSGHGDIPTTVRAMRGGAIDFLTKPLRRDDLFGALTRALLRDAELRASVREIDEQRRRLASLTPREQEVLRHVIAGKLNKQTAFELKTGERTIKAHRANIVRKLRVSSVAELVRLAETLRIAPAP